MFATTARDGYVMLHILPSLELVRSIKISNNLFANNIYLSNSPLPCLTIYLQVSQRVSA